MSGNMYIGGEDGTAKRVQKIYIGYNKKAKSLLKNSSFINDTDWTNNITYYSYSFEEDYATITVKKAPSTNGSYPTGQVAYNQVIEPRIIVCVILLQVQIWAQEEMMTLGVLLDD